MYCTFHIFVQKPFINGMFADPFLELLIMFFFLNLNLGQTSLRPNDWLDGDGSQILSSSPKLLFCELVLRPGEVKTFR